MPKATKPRWQRDLEIFNEDEIIFRFESRFGSKFDFWKATSPLYMYNLF